MHTVIMPGPEMAIISVIILQNLYFSYGSGLITNIQTAGWNETIFINGVKISFHPAGHMIGSAQVRVEYQRRGMGSKW